MDWNRARKESKGVLVWVQKKKEEVNAPPRRNAFELLAPQPAAAFVRKKRGKPVVKVTKNIGKRYCCIEDIVLMIAGCITCQTWTTDFEDSKKVWQFGWGGLQFASDSAEDESDEAMDETGLNEEEPPKEDEKCEPLSLPVDTSQNSLPNTNNSESQLTLSDEDVSMFVAIDDGVLLTRPLCLSETMEDSSKESENEEVRDYDLVLARCKMTSATAASYGKNHNSSAQWKTARFEGLNCTN